MGLLHRSEGSDEATGRALARTRRSWRGRLGGLFGGGLTPELWESLEEALIAADAGVGTTMDVLGRVREAGPRSPAALRELLAAELVALLEGPAGSAPGRLWGPGAEPPEPPAVVLVVGVNGSGKTTGIARLAHAYREQGSRVLLAAGDTFRAAAIDQLRQWGERLSVEVVAHRPGADPAAVAFDTVEAARARGHDLVLVDTAGRLHNRKNLMDELAKIRRVIERQLGRGPDEVLLVLDATTGQNGLEQARVFTEVVDVTALLLSKLDGSARGGIVFAVASELGLPVRFVGVGQEPGDLAPFDPAGFVSALLAEPATAGA